MMKNLRRALMKRRVSFIIRADGQVAYYSIKGRVNKKNEPVIKSLILELADELKGR
jgi:peroxiredoxin